MKEIKGYKVFEHDWTCRGFQYSCPGVFERKDKPELCKNGFHFCQKAVDCFSYYAFDPKNKVAEVIAFGKVVSDGAKSCTNKIRIVREITWSELLCIVNTGEGCTGYNNTGSWNTRDYNVGCYNTGCYNTGYWNDGNRNTGDSNIGDGNSGNFNTGRYNVGNCNTGNYNTGDWNKSSYNNGCFMTEEPKISMFNKLSDWSYTDWCHSGARDMLIEMSRKTTCWVRSEDMTAKEKAEYPSHKVTGGYLQTVDTSESRQLWWNSLTRRKKNVIKGMPNFDPEIFEECTGIKVD